MDDRDKLIEIMAVASYARDSAAPDCGGFESESDMMQQCYRERAAFVLDAAEREGWRFVPPNDGR